MGECQGLVMNPAFIFAALGIEGKAFVLLGKCFTTELHPCSKYHAYQEGRSFLENEIQTYGVPSKYLVDEFP